MKKQWKGRNSADTKKESYKTSTVKTYSIEIHTKTSKPMQIYLLNMTIIKQYKPSKKIKTIDI